MPDESKYYKEVSLETFAQGEDGAKVAAALETLYANIDDPNTDAKATRKLTFEVVFKPSEDRENIAITTAVKITTAPVKKSQKPMVLVHRDGKLRAYTFNPKQGDLFPASEPATESDPQVASISAKAAQGGGK